MSVTDILSSSRYPELKDKLNKEFLKPKITIDFSRNDINIGHNSYALIGAAFDYFIRFKIQKNNTTAKLYKNELIAEKAVSVIIRREEKYKYPKISIGNKTEKIYARTEFIELLNSKQIYWKNSINEYFESEKVTDDILNTCLDYARLDSFYRVGIIDDKIGEYNSILLNDLKDISQKLDISNFNAKNEIFLNPNFGDGSTLVGGADADLIIDKTLIEVKTTIRPAFNRPVFNQLIFYYVLSLIGGVNGDRKCKPIEYIAVYFSRQGVYLSFPLNEIVDLSRIIEIRDWFAFYLMEKGMLLDELQLD